MCLYVNSTEASLMRYVGLSTIDDRTGPDDYSSHTARPGKRSNDTAKRAKRRSHHSQSPSHYVLQTSQRDSPPRDPASIYHVSQLIYQSTDIHTAAIFFWCCAQGGKLIANVFCI